MGMYKYRFGNGLAFFEGKDVQLMERMARKGYSPVGANALGFYKFVKTEPEDISYSVDFSNILSCSDEFETYKEIFQSGGWEYVCSVGPFHWFKAKKGTTPIYTDKPNEADKYGNMFRFSFKTALVTLIAALLFFVLWQTTSVRSLEILLAVLFGASFGIAIAMGIGAILNYRRISKLI